MELVPILPAQPAQAGSLMPAAGHPAALILQTLPVELLCNMIQCLDPISLIALAQTSQFFRALIQPTHAHFVRRLHVMEQLPEYGGKAVFISDSYHPENQSPAWPGEDWKQLRYACAGCLKLLSHMRFDNHAIFRSAYTKPPPESGDVDRLTDWEPLRPGAISSAKLAELKTKRTGWLRHRRLCLECRMQRGHFGRVDHDVNGSGNSIDAENAQLLLISRSPPDLDAFHPWQLPIDPHLPKVFNRGTAECPVVVSRHVMVDTWNDQNWSAWAMRFFAGFFKTIDERNRPDGLERKWTNLTWHEVAAFRIFSREAARPAPPPWIARVGRLVCNECLLLLRGRSELRSAVCCFAKALVLTERSHAVSRMMYGWEKMEAIIRPPSWAEPVGLGQCVNETGRELIYDTYFADLPWSNPAGVRYETANTRAELEGEKWFSIDSCDFADLLERHGRIIEAVELEARRPGNPSAIPGTWLNELYHSPCIFSLHLGRSFWVWWKQIYPSLDAYRRVTSANIDMIMDDPDHLVDYVLRNPYKA